MSIKGDGGLKVVLSAVGGNFFITIIKFIGFFMSGSSSLLAEAVHSFADTLNQILLLIGIKHSKRPSNQNYPFGMGRAKYMWNLISAVGIFFLGFAFTSYHAIESLLHLEDGPHSISSVGIGVLVISFIIEFYVLMLATKEINSLKGKRTFIEYLLGSDDPTSVAVFFEDFTAVLGVCLALLGMGLSHLTASALPDIITSLIIAFLMGGMAIILGILNGKLLIGRAKELHEENEIKLYLESLPEIEHVNSISTTILGPQMVRLSVEVELHGEMLLTNNMISKQVQRLKDGDDPAKILVEQTSRTIRILGEKINQIEKLVRSEYPEIVSIEFEVS
ncbi:MAG: cation diffusion facilitator family transporter [Halobacteriovoraceae bacterium]|nr:cation diffusion facilitator family transporter [Halobacteriovoraceae bacterium]